MNNLKMVLAKVIIAALLCVMGMNTYTSSKFYGSAQLTDQKYTDLEINGSGYLTKVTVTNSAVLRGSAHLVDFTCPQLTVQGSLHCEAITVNNADVFGSFHCKDGRFDLLTIHGSCVVTATKISKKLSVHGLLIASDMECPLIEVSSTHVELKNSSVNTIIVKKINNTYKGILNLWGLFSWWTHSPQASEVYLDKSFVDSITFQGLPGRVILTHQATIGTVVNGTIENR